MKLISIINLSNNHMLRLNKCYNLVLSVVIVTILFVQSHSYSNSPILSRKVAILNTAISTSRVRQEVSTSKMASDDDADQLVHGGYNHCAMIVKNIDQSTSLYQVSGIVIGMYTFIVIM